MMFMVIERFRNRDPKPIYRRLRDQGRQMPDDLKYVDSWIDPTFERCFQLMQCDDVRLLQQWIVRWSDLIDFEIVPVVPSKETQEIVAPYLDSAPNRARRPAIKGIAGQRCWTRLAAASATTSSCLTQQA